MKRECPHCHRKVKVVDPYATSDVKRASAWFARHKDWRTGKLCAGSNTTAIARTPRPASEDAAILDCNAGVAGKWGVSRDEMSYHGAYDTEAEAEAEAEEGDYIGQYRAPSKPEAFITTDLIDDLIESISEHEDYGGEWAENWYDGNREQQEELAAAFRNVFAAWLDRHDLRPKFGIVDTCRRVEKTAL